MLFLNRKMIARLAAACLLMVFCAACSLSSRQGTFSPTLTLTPTRLSTGTLSPPGRTLTQVSGTVAAPATDWKTYTDAAAGITFAYPPDWQETSPGSFTGSGFARVELRANDGASQSAVCQAEANQDKPQRYGAFPEIQDTSLETAPACLILPSADQPAQRQGEALYLLWLPAPVRQNTLWVLHADKDHISAIVKSLRMSQTSATPSASHCAYQDKTLKTNTYHQGGLRIDEYPIAPAVGCSPYLEPEGFQQIASTGAPAAAATQVVNSQFTYSRLAQINTALAKFGFQVQVYNQKLFRVLKNGNVLRSNIFWVGQLTVNTSGTDFILPIVDSYNSITMLVRPGGVQMLENWDLLLYDNIFPVFVGNDQISLAYDYQRYPRQPNDPALLQVKKNDQVIDTLSIDGSTPTRGPVRGLWAWQDHWVLELPDYVIQDGQALNDQLGYSEIFTWRLLSGKPFYFFRKAGQIHMAYAEQPLPVTYDEVIHTPQWNTALLLELKAYPGGVLFYARRGDTWYYVVLRSDTP